MTQQNVMPRPRTERCNYHSTSSIGNEAEKLFGLGHRSKIMVGKETLLITPPHELRYVKLLAPTAPFDLVARLGPSPLRSFDPPLPSVSCSWILGRKAKRTSPRNLTFQFAARACATQNLVRSVGTSLWPTNHSQIRTFPFASFGSITSNSS